MVNLGYATTTREFWSGNWEFNYSCKIRVSRTHARKRGKWLRRRLGLPWPWSGFAETQTSCRIDATTSAGFDWIGMESCNRKCVDQDMEKVIEHKLGMGKHLERYIPWRLADRRYNGSLPTKIDYGCRSVNKTSSTAKVQSLNAISSFHKVP